MGGEVGGGRTDGAVLSVVLNPGAGGWEPAAPSQVPWGGGCRGAVPLISSLPTTSLVGDLGVPAVQSHIL